MDTRRRRADVFDEKIMHIKIKIRVFSAGISKRIYQDEVYPVYHFHLLSLITVQFKEALCLIDSKEKG